jgi:sugar lactone lactonase YvrE
MVRTCWLTLAAVLVAGAASAPAAAVTLAPGDLVLLSSRYYPEREMWKLDPVTLQATPITSGGLLVDPANVTVAAGGIVYVADAVSGIVRVSSETGSQSVLLSPADLGGRPPEGVCLAPDGGLYVTVFGGANAAVLHVDPGTRAVETISSGGLMSWPSDVAVGPAGELYVAEFGDRHQGTGAILRIDPVGGAQSVLAAGTELFHGPYDIAVAPDGWVWSAQRGTVGRRSGFFVRTRMADGFSESVDGRSFGLAVGHDGPVFLGDCRVIGQDCIPDWRYVWRYPDHPEPQDAVYLRSGPMAVVPQGTTTATRRTWGTLKVRYR